MHKGQGYPNSDIQDRSTHNGCCINWFLQILVWLSLVCLIALGAAGNSNGTTACAAIFAILYIIYLIVNFCSHTAKYLSNKKTGDKMKMLVRIAKSLKISIQVEIIEAIDNQQINQE